MNKDSKFTIVIDVLGVIAFWMIAIGTMWSVYYTRLVYIQNKQAMSVTITTPSSGDLSTTPDDNGPSITIPSDPNNPPDFQDNPYVEQVPLSF